MVIPDALLEVGLRDVGEVGVLGDFGREDEGESVGVVLCNLGDLERQFFPMLNSFNDM